MNRLKFQSAALILVAALLWATDSVVRPQAAGVDSRWLVFAEHVIGLVLVAPLAFLLDGAKVWKVGRRDLGLFLLAGGCGSVLGGIFFTRSLQILGGGPPTLFQMAQPLVVVALAHFFLRERRGAFFFQCAVWVIFNSILIAIPTLEMGLPENDAGAGLLYGALAMVAWGISTVAGKALLARHRPATVVFWRWVIAVLTLAVTIAIAGVPAPDFSVATGGGTLLPILYLGIVAGVFPMLIYYHGMRNLPVSTVTFIEVAYPLAGIFLTGVVSGQPISVVQIIGGFTLIVALTLLTQSSLSGTDAEVSRL